MSETFRNKYTIDGINKNSLIKKSNVRDINSSNGISRVIEPTELGESLRELNQDNIQENTNMSGIDMRSRLFPSEISGILAIDFLVGMNFLDIQCLNLTRQKKRLAVSMMGKGRQEIVDIVAGKRDMDSGAKANRNLFERIGISKNYEAK